MSKSLGSHTALSNQAVKVLCTTCVIHPYSCKHLYIKHISKCFLASTFTQLHSKQCTGDNSGFNILPKGILTCRLEKLWIKPSTFHLDDLLYLLNNCHHIQDVFFLLLFYSINLPFADLMTSVWLRSVCVSVALSFSSN